MPQYQYHCNKCQNIITEFKNVKDRINTPLCSKCGNQTNRIMSASSFIVNGYNAKNNYSKCGGSNE